MIVIATITKIKINDVSELRQKLDQIYEFKSQVDLARWALQLSKYIFTLIDYDYENDSVIAEGFAVNEKWQSGDARMYDVRQAGFKVHKLARRSENPIIQAAIRVAGQAIGTGHMKEHAMVASDYAIKVLNLKYPNNMEVVEKLREWQIRTMGFNSKN